MVFRVFIEPHERVEAMEAYRDWLTPDQVDEIMDAPESALIYLSRSGDATGVTVIEEG